MQVTTSHQHTSTAVTTSITYTSSFFYPKHQEQGYN
jgi:hypothetical protein